VNLLPIDVFENRVPEVPTTDALNIDIPKVPSFLAPCRALIENGNFQDMHAIITKTLAILGVSYTFDPTSVTYRILPDEYNDFTIHLYRNEGPHARKTITVADDGHNQVGDILPGIIFEACYPGRNMRNTTISAAVYQALIFGEIQEQDNMDIVDIE